MKKLFFHFLTLFIFSTCTTNEEEVLEPQQSLDISVEEVRGFVSSQPTSKNGRSSSNDLEILYEGSAYKEISFGNALVFPVKPSKNLYIRGTNSTKWFSVASTSFTMAYKYEGKVFLDLIQPIPTSNSSLFTGFVLISKWGGEAKRVLFYEEGEFVGERGGSESNGRSNRVDCISFFTESCGTIIVGGFENEDCHLESNQICVFQPDNDPDMSPDNIISEGPSSGGGGGVSSTGGGSPADEENCPHPFEPNLTVPCNESTCDGTVINGNCVADIVNTITNPCLRDVTENLTDNDLQNNINASINEIFDDNNSTINLVLVEDRVRNVLASTTYDINQLTGRIDITIHWNTNYLFNQSKEFIAGILFHEAMHAYLNINSTSRDQLIQHKDIAANYISWINSALREAYPNLTNKQANGLALRFLGDVNRTEPAYFNALANDLGFSSVQDVIDETQPFGEGDLGTDCN